MNNPFFLLRELLNIKTEKKSMCYAGHIYCLNCETCRAGSKIENNQDFPKNIDHTLLKPGALKREIDKLIDEYFLYGFHSICVSPCYVNYVSSKTINVRITAVADFPFGHNSITEKLFEVDSLIDKGAAEIDIVQNISHIKNKEFTQCLEEFIELQKLCTKRKIVLKIILENSLLDKDEICISSLIAKKAGVDYIKTSTGFFKTGAKVEDVVMMRRLVGDTIGIKASGGIKSYKTALDLMNAGADRLGTSKSIDIIKEKKIEE